MNGNFGFVSLFVEAANGDKVARWIWPFRPVTGIMFSVATANPIIIRWRYARDHMHLFVSAKFDGY